jgi:hypothetical protein
MIQVFDRQQFSIKRYRSKTFPISPLALRENQFFHTFPVIETQKGREVLPEKP